MRFSAGLTTAEILAAFTDEVSARGGRVTDTFHNGGRLFARSVLPQLEDVRPGDRLQGGVAVRATERQVWVHPYLFRQVCQNGAIVAEALGTRHLADLDAGDADEAMQSVREAVGACCERDVFAATVRRVRTGCEVEADLVLNLMPHLARLSAMGNTEVLTAILTQFFQDGDRSRYGLANAVTATARETPNPELRWDLEELGGGIAIGNTAPRPETGPAAMEQRRRAVLVG
jgi:hypothetical protein